MASPNRQLQDFSFDSDSEPDDEHANETDVERKLIENTNKLLSATGIVAKKIMSLAELARVASSIFVAIFESVYHTRIEGIIRSPVTKEDYEHNAQLVIDRLSEQINSELTHITGEQIVNGDTIALRNLVNIFMRILTVTSRGVRSTSTIESEVSMDDGDFFADHRRNLLLDNSMASISTKDSIPQAAAMTPKRSKSPANTPSGSPARSPRKTLSAHTPSKKYEDAVHKSLERAEGFLKKEVELHQAAIRRKNARLWKQTQLRKENQRRRETTQSTKQYRGIQDMRRSEASFRLKCDNEESVLLRKVYQALLRETLRFRTEEKLQEKAYVRAKEKELEHQLESLQTLFRERLEAYRLEEEATVHFPMEALKQGRLAYLGLEQRYEQLLEREKNWRNQCQDQEICKKRQGYRNLLAMLKAEKWSDSLRAHC